MIFEQYCRDKTDFFSVQVNIGEIYLKKKNRLFSSDKKNITWLYFGPTF